MSPAGQSNLFSAVDEATQRIAAYTAPACGARSLFVKAAIDT